MALGSLGQPFGSPGGIINIPAPVGAEKAGRGLDGLGQLVGAFIAMQQKKNQQGLQQQDQAAIQ